MEEKIRLCPDCGKEMEAGYLEIDRFATFNRERRTLLNGILLEEHDLILTGDGILSNHGGSFHAWVCRDCGLMLFGYENNRAGKGRHPLDVIADKVDGFFDKIDKMTEKEPDSPSEPEATADEPKKRTVTAAGVVDDTKETR